jgi:hypothetical protein
MAKAGDLFEKVAGIKVLVFGDPGAGKTTWGAQAPSPLVLLTEHHGLASVACANPDADVVLVRNWTHLMELLKELKAGVAEGGASYRATIQGEDLTFDTLVLDSLTNVHESMVETYVEPAGEKEVMRAWNKVQRYTKAMLHDLRSLPCNVVALCLAKETTDSADRRRVVPSMYGQMSGQVGQFFSAVGYSHKRNGGYAIAWELADATYITKRPPGSSKLLPSCTFASDEGDGCTLGQMVGALYQGDEAAAAAVLWEPKEVSDRKAEAEARVKKAEALRAEQDARTEGKGKSKTKAKSKAGTAGQQDIVLP